MQVVCETIKAALDSLPGDERTLVGLVTYDAHVHFYNLSARPSRRGPELGSQTTLLLCCGVYQGCAGHVAQLMVHVGLSVRAASSDQRALSCQAVAHAAVPTPLHTSAWLWSPRCIHVLLVTRPGAAHLLTSASLLAFVETTRFVGYQDRYLS